MVSQVNRVEWEEVCATFAHVHKLGEHVSCVGPNGSGKSTLMLALLEERGRRKAADGRPTRIAILANKPRDSTLTALGWPRLTKMQQWPPGYGKEQCIVWPAYGDPQSAVQRQEQLFRYVLREALPAGNQIIYIDEAAYFTESKPDGLGMRAMLSQYWQTSRSVGVSVVASTQRPRRVPVAMWTEPYWLFIFRPKDEEDLKRVAQLSGHKQLVLEVVPELGAHEFLMIRDRPERMVAVSEVEV